MASSALSPAARAVLTPVKQTTTTPPPATESPGDWRHPRLAEITQRQARSVFSEKNAKQVLYNSFAWLILYISRRVARSYLPAKLYDSRHTNRIENSQADRATSRFPPEYNTLIFVALCLVPLFNVIVALSPLFRADDDLSDIPLTPAQRELLGLPPSSKKPTPDAIRTPPRYSRTPSLAGSPASLRSYTGSPTPNLGSPASNNNSPAPVTSPLLQKAVVGGALSSARRSSFGSSGGFGASTSSFGASTATSLFGDGPATPTPMTGKRSSVSLNNKWLYEKGREKTRRSSGNNWGL
ncbi:hypothetical protein OQA88_6200 [Cercophora sp. LCS_1]